MYPLMSMRLAKPPPQPIPAMCALSHSCNQHDLPCTASLLCVSCGAFLAEHGIMVTPALRDSSGAIILGAAFLHFAVLGGVFADSPAAAALRYSIKSFTAYFSCAFCKLVGTMCDGAVRFCGYIKPVLTPAGAGQGRSYQMGAQDGRLLSDLEQRAQAAAAAVNDQRPTASSFPLPWPFPGLFLCSTCSLRA